MKKITLTDDTLLFLPDDYIPSFLLVMEEAMGRDAGELIRETLDNYADRVEKLEAELCAERRRNSDTRQRGSGKTTSNADRIRAMSDEELAMNFEDYGLCKYIQRCDFPWCEGRANCSWCVEEWLKQPAKEDA